MQRTRKKQDLTLSWLIWSCAGLFYLYEYVLRVSPSVMTQELMQFFGVTSTSLGVLVSFYYAAYVPLQIPCGMLLDYFGLRKTITTSAALCTIGALLFAYSDSLVIAKCGRFLMGMGSACAYVSCMKAGAEWFPARYFALISGLTLMMGTLGGTFAGRPFAILVNYLSWQNAMIFMSFVGIIVTIICGIIIKSPKAKTDKTEKIPSLKEWLTGIRYVFHSKQNWLLGLYGSLMYLPLSAFAELWGVPYLMQRFNIDNTVASSSSIMVFIGVAVGSPLLGSLSNSVKDRRFFMGTIAFLASLLLFAVLYVPHLPLWAVTALLFSCGVCCGGHVIAFVIAKESTPPTYLATNLGFINCLVMMSGLISQPLLGYLLDTFWSGRFLTEGIRYYSSENYTYALTFLSFAMCLGVILQFFVKEPRILQPNGK